MGYNAKSFPFSRVWLDDVYYADLTPLTKAENDEANVILVGGTVEGPVLTLASMRARLHQREYTDFLLVHAIKDWNLDDEQDPPQKLPITIENIKALRNDHSTKLCTELSALTNPVEQMDPATKLE